MNKNLKPCPFCGGEASVIAKVVYKHVLYYVQCKDCGVTNHPYAVEQGVIATKYEDVPSIKAWNRREPIDKIVEQLIANSGIVEDGDGHAGHFVFTETAIEIVKGGAV